MLSRIACVAFAVAPTLLGGTWIAIPIGDVENAQKERIRENLKSVALDLYECSCDRKPDPDHLRFDRCSVCGADLVVRQDNRIMAEVAATFEKGRLELAFAFGDAKNVYVLKWSSLESCLKGAGVTVDKRPLSFQGAFQIHAKANENLLKDLGGTAGVKSVTACGAIYIVNGSAEHEGQVVRLQDLDRTFRKHDVEVDDYSWVVNRCLGETGLVGR